MLQLMHSSLGHRGIDNRPIEQQGAWINPPTNNWSISGILIKIDYWEYLERIMVTINIVYWILKLWEWKNKQIVRRITRKDQNLKMGSVVDYTKNSIKVPPVREIQVPVMDTEEKPEEIELERRNTRKKKRWY